MGEKVNRCLWCQTPLKEGLFCVGGGRTRGQSVTGEKGFTKSFCYHDFLVMYKLTKKLKWELTEEEKIFAIYEEPIKEWYKNLPLFFERHKAMAVGHIEKNGKALKPSAEFNISLGADEGEEMNPHFRQMINGQGEDRVV